MKFLELDDVLCLSPHPDDTEFSISGTALKYYSTNFYVLCMSKGGAPGFDLTNDEYDRRTEVNNFWSELKTQNVTVLHSNCDYLTDKSEPEWINYIEDLFFRPETFKDKSVGPALMIPTYQDSQFEHRFVSQLGNGLIRSKPISLIEYKTISTLTEWNPNLTVNISSEYIRKIDALQNFESQGTKPFFTESIQEQFHTDYRMSRRGIKYSEQFKILECFI